MRITSKGQVTIPKKMRERFALRPETEVEFIAENDGLRLVRVPDSSRGKQLARQMRGTATVAMSTDEIMQLTRG
ncbi:MAG: AbrB/MazE/SpoVT family DNA-binding domain-containing protein [Mariprofundaceae bacterium]|nr:AbrB/MazE/SpoVT family DNA-binding domain-containing protein [Mariprofundaceae bacterium]